MSKSEKEENKGPWKNAKNKGKRYINQYKEHRWQFVDFEDQHKFLPN